MFQKPTRAIWLTFVLALFLAVAAGCQASEPEPTPSPAEVEATTEAAVEEFVDSYALAATAWDLAYFGGPEDELAMLPDTRASVIYFWDRYAGFDGCNWFLGVYTADADGELRMMTPSRTNDICAPEELYEQAATYVSMLENVTAYLLEEDQLLANTVEDQRMLTFDSATVLPMVGTDWDLKFSWLADQEQWSPIVPLSVTTIQFGEGGEATGSGGCNEFTVPYEGDLQIEKVMEATSTYAELPTLTFGPITSQMAECSDPEYIMDQEQNFFATLGSVAYYFKLGGMVIMMDSEGSPLMVLSARS